MELKARLLGSFLLFTQTFYKLNTGRDFVISSPAGKEPHQITIARQLTQIFNLEELFAWMTIPPGFGKSTLVSYFVPWAWAHYPDSQFLYISYSSSLATKHTTNIRSIMQLPTYRELFGVKLCKDSLAKDNFKTIYGGSIQAFGSAGSITGQDGGLQNISRFSGAIIMDDMHKPDEVFSDVIRQSIIDNYGQTIKTRRRGENVPIIGIGQALHEDDLRNFLISGKDGNEWKDLTLEAQDDQGNSLAPNIISRESLDKLREHYDYVYWSQYQGRPRPAGGGIFKTDWFELIDVYPNMLTTFITVDTAESTKDYADYTVFSFWGFYEITYREQKTGKYGLHWIDCVQERMEPADLEGKFLEFYSSCLGFNTPPKFIAIEKKSTGSTLISILNKMRGFEVISIERTKASGSKTARYLEMQPYFSERLISLPTYSRHTSMCIEHMIKITTNDTHRHDDICDTAYDAVKMAFIDKILKNRFSYSSSSKDNVCTKLLASANRINKLRSAAYGR